MSARFPLLPSGELVPIRCPLPHKDGQREKGGSGTSLIGGGDKKKTA